MPKDKALDENFLTPTKFSQEIERLVKKSNGLISYIEAVVTYCQENEVEIETVPKLLNKPLKERLRHEAQRLNYMKVSSKGVLPLRQDLKCIKLILLSNNTSLNKIMTT